MIYWYLRSRLFEWQEQRRVESLFYSNSRFKILDQLLLRNYASQSAFAISKAFHLKRQDPNPYLYGETPLTTLAALTKRFQISESDTLLELGAGRGRGALFFAEWVGCRVIAIEQVPAFVQRARALPSERLSVLEGDYFHFPLPPATVVYLYGSHLSEQEAFRLSDALQQMPIGAKIVSVSAPLPGFPSVDQMTGRFPWGRATIYLSIR